MATRYLVTRQLNKKLIHRQEKRKIEHQYSPTVLGLFRVLGCLQQDIFGNDMKAETDLSLVSFDFDVLRNFRKKTKKGKYSCKAGTKQTQG